MTAKRAPRSRLPVLFGLLFVSLSAASAPDGAQLYARNCAACHGSDGRGGVGVPLALPSFLASVDDEFLRTTIREGRPGRVMPAFRDLSDAQVDALVAYLRRLAPGTPAPRFDPTPVQGDPQRGAGLYGKHCAACHGPRGEGGHGTGVTFSRPRELPIMPPALRNRGFLRAASDQMIKATLERGRPGTPMVSFLDKGLSEQDLSDIVAYIRSWEAELDEELPRKTDERQLLIAESSYGLAETVENVKRAVTSRQFRIVRVQYLEDGLAPPEEVDKSQIIVYFCNFHQLNDALAIDPRVGLFLPCRVTVLEREGKVYVSTLNPANLSILFNNRELYEMCAQITTLYEEILEEATL